MTRARPLKIALSIRSLTTGGAQLQLVKLAIGLKSRGASPSVIVLYSGGVLEESLLAGGVPVHCLEKRHRWDVAGPFFRFLRLARVERYDVMYSFLPLANLLSLAVARLAGTPLAWGLRGAAQDVGQHGLASRLLYALQSALRGAPERIISNSYAAIDELGEYVDGRYFVVANGIDTERFHPDAVARMEVRREFGWDEQVKVVGCVARLDPVKDHRVALAAAAVVAQSRPNARFLFVGSGPEGYRAELERAARDCGLGSRAVWAGERTDVMRVMSALDVYISASRAEGTSNSLAEAMACGIVPVVTNVGDSARVVGAHGSLVPIRNPEALAREVLSRLDDDCAGAQSARRAWIIGTFGVERMVDETLGILATVAERHLRD